MADLPKQSHEVLNELSKERLIDTVLLQAEKIAELVKDIAWIKEENAGLKKENAGLKQENDDLKGRIDKIEAKLNSDSTNSNQPPSSDSPYKKHHRDSGKKGKPGAKKGHKGYRQQMIDPDETVDVPPKPCSCGCGNYKNLKTFYTHQYIEFPEVKPEVTHFNLQQGDCINCGKVNKAQLPNEYTVGFGPRMTAVVAELAGSHGDSRTIIQNFCFSVLGVSISLGAIQNMIDRASKAIEPHYNAIGDKARKAETNHVDETSWFEKAKLIWLWVLANATVAFFMIHEHRSKEAFKTLIKDWAGILVSDGYGMYRKWENGRQACLAHLIRKAKALSESKNPDIAKFGNKAWKELQKLCHMAHAPPTMGEWRMFYARFITLITRNIANTDETGKFARSLMREIDSLWLFLEKAGVSPTNNHAERILRFAVCWRKRSLGTASEKGNRWVERILSLRQTCRLQGKRTFPILVAAIDSLFTEQKPDLTWIEQA